MRNAYRTGNTARAAMTANAGTAYKLIETINTDVQQMLSSDQRFEQYQAITEAKQAFMLARYEVRGYTAKSNAENERKAVAQLDAAIASLQPLNAYFASTRQDELRQLEAEIGRASGRESVCQVV